ncbi:GntR family transcriptional regulator [uncultured Roseibium sp.]|uniref:GntR family transcriptional regulator n=1 Tax=uncultured Roseibium sp. TaxID=1936171 RepID=UPI002623545F|nr:GntR family transcriptional regulator [uncultured Roseibium sp.]
MTHQNTKKSDQIAELLAAGIVRGEIPPGEKLRQDQIAQDFQSSHVPVREALLRLVAQGLAISLPRRGVCVAPFDKSSVRELIVMRKALEPVALMNSVLNLTRAQIESAEEARLGCDDANSAQEWEEANRDFHLAIVSGCGMPRLVEEISNLQMLYARHFLAQFSDQWQKRADKDHQAILTAIYARDTDGAVEILRRHLAKLR